MSIETYRDSSRTVEAEVVTRLKVTSGALPPGLRGVLYRNGPGRLERGGVDYGHPFDGDGHLTRFAFDDEGVAYRNRFVQTDEFRAEEAAGRLLYRGFGTNLPGGLWPNLLRTRFKNAANTSIHRWGGKLMALWEGGLPHAIDPVTLDCLGRHDFGGKLRPRSTTARLLTPELPFSAHPRVDHQTGELFNFGTVFGPRNRLMLYRVDAAGRMDEPRALDLDRLVFLHDFTLTRRYQIFFLFPVTFDVPRAVLGLLPPASAIQQRRGEPTRIWLVPRDGGPTRVAQARPGFVFHFTGAHDDGDRVVVDGFRLDDFPRVDGAGLRKGMPIVNFGPPTLTRFTIDPARGSVDERPLTDHPGELPGTSPLAGLGPRRYTWAIGARPGHPDPFYKALWKLDTDSGALTLRELGDDMPGEPVIIPRPGATEQDDAWLLTLVYRAQSRRSDLLILDARTLSDIACLSLPHHVPPGFHGTWVPEA